MNIIWREIDCPNNDYKREIWLGYKTRKPELEDELYWKCGYTIKSFILADPMAAPCLLTWYDIYGEEKFIDVDISNSRAKRLYSK